MAVGTDQRAEDGVIDLTTLNERSPVIDDPHGDAPRGDDETDGPDGWSDALRRIKTRLQAMRAPLLSGGVAFYLLLSLFPALAALVSVYGLISEPREVRNQIGELLASAPDDARNLVVDQVERFVQTSGSGLGTALALSVVAALWSASSGIKHLMTAVAEAQGRKDQRGFVAKRLVALGLTAGALVLGAAAIAVLTALPRVLASLDFGAASRIALNAGAYVLLATLFALGLAVLYRYAGADGEPEWRVAGVGAAVATLLWIVASIGFGFYATNFGSFGETYGSIGAVVIVMLWLAITAFAAILGAVIDRELES